MIFVHRQIVKRPPSLKEYKRLWAEFHHGLISKTELVEGLEKITKCKGDISHVK